ncbi:MAG TPA: fumarylacetoacetate hydrolase family protein [Edaphocola sp.]|nr:fumarylacetoacetate hydrolase family protein [Edaphocola sp.]
MKIFCVGRNYLAHAREMNAAVPKQPVIFMKPATALADLSKPLVIPAFTNDLQYELELVLRICRDGKAIAISEAGDYFKEWTVGIDFTARDIQSDMKAKGLPWELAKSFDGSAVLGNFVPFVEDLLPVTFSLYKNDLLAQQGHTEDLIFSFEALIAFISKYFTLQTGDLIYTGTPAGVAKVLPGDRLSGFLNQDRLFEIEMTTA